jgi:hypothetical protein
MRNMIAVLQGSEKARRSKPMWKSSAAITTM